jgi:hypothetical protein
MTDIYDQHKAAFSRVSAYVILRNGERVATIAFKFPADGAGRLYAYVHWLGVPMVRGHASGYGYDNARAACANAVKHFFSASLEAKGVNFSSFYHEFNPPHWKLSERANFAAFREALKADRGPQWDSALREAGFTVLQAV